MDQTHNSVVLWQKSKDVGEHMSGVLLSTHGRPDPERMTQLGHSLQVKGNMERVWFREKGLVFLKQHFNI